MGFSIDEMSMFSMTEFLELVDIYIKRMSPNQKEEEIIYEATQEDIDKFLG